MRSETCSEDVRSTADVEPSERRVESSTQTDVNELGDDDWLTCSPCAPAAAPDRPPALVYDDGTMNIGYRNAERLALELGIN